MRRLLGANYSVLILRLIKYDYIQIPDELQKMKLRGSKNIFGNDLHFYKVSDEIFNGHGTFSKSTSKISDIISSPRLSSKINSNVSFGNAVPVNLAYDVGKQAVKAINEYYVTLKIKKKQKNKKKVLKTA